MLCNNMKNNNKSDQANIRKKISTECINKEIDNRGESENQTENHEEFTFVY